MQVDAFEASEIDHGERVQSIASIVNQSPASSTIEGLPHSSSEPAFQPSHLLEIVASILP